MQYSIQPISQGDLNEWQALYQGYAEFYQVPMPPTTLDQVWQWIHAEDMEFYGLMARNEQGVAIGLMHYRAMPSPLRGTIVGFLDDLFIDPQYRGQGLVDQMFAALNEQAKQHAWPFVRWITAENNYRGRGVYDRLADKTHWVTYQMAAE